MLNLIPSMISHQYLPKFPSLKIFYHIFIYLDPLSHFYPRVPGFFQCMRDGKREFFVRPQRALPLCLIKVLFSQKQIAEPKN